MENKGVMNGQVLINMNNSNLIGRYATESFNKSNIRLVLIY